MNFRINSHQKAINAINSGYFKARNYCQSILNRYMLMKTENEKRNLTQLTPMRDRDRIQIRKRLSKLKPVFAAKGTVTAGNSSQTSDGAAFVIVMSEKMVNELES